MSRPTPLYALIFVLTAAALFGPSPGAEGQSCNEISVSVFPGDGSDPPGDQAVVNARGVGNPDPLNCTSPECSTSYVNWGDGFAHPGCCGTRTYELRAAEGHYLTTPWMGTITCVQQEPCCSCVLCGGHVGLPLFANSGNFVGRVFRFPNTAPVVGRRVTSSCGNPFVGPLTDSLGEYNFARGQGAPYEQNNWGIGVTGDGSGPGSGTYTLSVVGCDPAQPFGTAVATTQSSRATTVNFSIWDSGFEQPTRCEGPSSNSGPGAGEASTASSNPAPEVPNTPACDVGCPVSVTTGAMHLDQTDVVIPGLGPGLRFVRSYNSQLRGPGQYGVFGPGWNHVYEQRLTVFSAEHVIMLRKANGNPAYFQDDDLNGRFDPSVPFNRASWIDTQPGPPVTYVRHFLSGGSETYDSQGRLVGMADVSGNTVTFIWNGGMLSSIAENSGRSLTLGYTGSQLTTLTGPAGLIATYGYWPAGTLQSVLYADGSGYDFTYYEGTNQLWTVADKTGRVLETHEYDGSGRAVTSEISEGREKFTLAFAPGGDVRKTKVTDARGNDTIYEFDMIWGALRVKKIVGPCASCGGGAEAQEWTYDDQGRVSTYTDGEGKTTRYEYDPNTGDFLKKIDPLNHETIYTYDPDGRVLTTAAPDGGLTTYTYLADRLETVKIKVSPTEDRLTQIDYTPQGKPEHITDPRGKITTLGYNAQGDQTSITLPPVPNSPPLVTDFTYDELGRRKTVTIHPSATESRTTTTDYDAQGRVRKITDPDQKATEFTYDLGGRRKTAKDALGRFTSYCYDSYGRPETVTQITDTAQGPTCPPIPTSGEVTKYEYDLMSNLEKITDARGKITRFEYDSFNRLKKTIWPGPVVREEGLTYDKRGLLKTRTDRKGVVTTYSYDDAGRLDLKSYSDGSPAVDYGYDNMGRLMFAIKGIDRVDLRYDLAGGFTSESSGSSNPSVAHLYDEAGNRTLRSLFFGDLDVPHDVYTYDEAGRPQYFSIMVTGGPKTFSFGHDAASRRVVLTHPNGLWTGYGYDPVSRLSGMSLKRGTEFVDFASYGYNAAGERTTKAIPEFSEAYSYDPVSRLKTVQRSSVQSEYYEYDAVGNRRVSLTAPTWTYNDRNELESFNGTIFTYDANGNVISKKTEGASGSTWTYEWSAENELTRVVKDGVEVARYAYDPLGRRIRRIIGSTTTVSYVYAGEDIVYATSGSTMYRFFHGPGIDEPLAVEELSGGTSLVRYYHADGLGSVDMITDSSSNPLVRYRYDSFGQVQLGGAVSGYAFTGREWDPETGLHYYRARYYDPKIGRFISEDPIGFDGGINFYPYVRNNPVNLTDPTGLKIQVCQRQAKVTWMAAMNGNHSYFWDPRQRNHMTPRDCGKGTIGPSPGTTGAESPDSWNTECYDVDGSDGLEDQLMICCRAQANSAIGTCWRGLGNCLDKFGLKMPAGAHMFGCTGNQCGS